MQHRNMQMTQTQRTKKETKAKIDKNMHGERRTQRKSRREETHIRSRGNKGKQREGGGESEGGKQREMKGGKDI